MANSSTCVWRETGISCGMQETIQDSDVEEIVVQIQSHA